MVDYDDIPESDPYCAHYISIFDPEHGASVAPCENCGESCHEHPVLWGAWCPNAPEGTSDRERHTYRNATWPVGETSPIRKPGDR